MIVASNSENIISKLHWVTSANVPNLADGSTFLTGKKSTNQNLVHAQADANKKSRAIFEENPRGVLASTTNSLVATENSLK
jgi:hypothetical protein